MPDEVTVRIERMDGFEHLSEKDWINKLERALHSFTATQSAGGQSISGKITWQRTDSSGQFNWVVTTPGAAVRGR